VAKVLATPAPASASWRHGSRRDPRTAPVHRRDAGLLRASRRHLGRKVRRRLAAYAGAIAEAGIPPGGVAVDVGCGTGARYPALRRTIGPQGTLIAIDVTPEMLLQARTHGRAEQAVLVVADARRLPAGRPVG